MKTLNAAEIANAGMRLRTLEGAPAIPRAPEPKRDPLLDMFDALRQSIDSMREAVMMERPEPKDENTALVLNAVKRVLEQNTRMLVMIHKTLNEPRESVAAPEPPEAEEWEFKVERDDYGRIKRVHAKEC